jgi:acyl-ACP thioesterase
MGIYATGDSGLAKVLMPVPDPHEEVFERQWQLRAGDVDRLGRLRLDGVVRYMQDMGQDHLREKGYDDVHPLWIVRRSMVDMIGPIEFKDTLRLRRWCSGASNRWCEMRVRIEGRRGGLIESEAFWINFNRETQGPARIADDFMGALLCTTEVNRLRWKAYMKAGSREDADEIWEFPIRVSDIDLFDHVNNSVYWKVVEEYLGPYPELQEAPLRVTIEHDAPIAYGDQLEVFVHVYPPGSTDKFGPELTDRTVRTLTYLVGDETKSVASIFPI